MFSAREYVNTRMQQNMNGKFSLLAVIKDRRVVLSEEIKNASSSNNNERLMVLNNQLMQEEETFAEEQKEVMRYQFNYVPFIMEALKVLISSDKITKLIDSAKEKAKTKNQR